MVFHNRGERVCLEIYAGRENPTIWSKLTSKIRSFGYNLPHLGGSLLGCSKLKVGLAAAFTKRNARVLVFLVHPNAQRGLDYRPDNEARAEDSAQYVKQAKQLGA